MLSIANVIFQEKMDFPSPWTTCVTTGWGGEGEGGGGREIEGEHGGDKDKKKMEHGYICFALAFLVAAILYLIDPNPTPSGDAWACPPLPSLRPSGDIPPRRESTKPRHSMPGSPCDYESPRRDANEPPLSSSVRSPAAA